MYLVLYEPKDLSAKWAFQGLKSRGLEPIELISVEEFSKGTHWEHRISGNDSIVNITLNNGHLIHGNKIQGVLNRILQVPTRYLQFKNNKDRVYVNQEFFAFFLSWLHSLSGRVINRPTPGGLCGEWRHYSEWNWLASKVGLSTSNYKMSSRDLPPKNHNQNISHPRSNLQTVIVIDDQVVGTTPIPEDVQESSKQLAKISNTEMLGINFETDSKRGWIFADATPFPNIKIGGDPLLDLLYVKLRAK